MRVVSKGFLISLAACVSILALSACGSKSNNNSGSTEDSSTSGSVASLVGGSMGNTQNGGTVSFNEPKFSKPINVFSQLFPNAYALGVCPTMWSGTGCSNDGSGNISLTYGSSPGCSFPGSVATWTGGQFITSSPSLTCNPSFAGYNGTITRYAGTATGSLTGAVRTAASGTSVSIDTGGAFVAADGNTYRNGVAITFASGVRTQIAIPGVNLKGNGPAGGLLFSHSISTSSPLVISGGNTIASGTVVTMHNLVKVQGASTFSNVSFVAGCCLPTSGSITTSFTAIPGVTPTALGSLFVGKSETLTFTGCGTGTYTGPEGYSGNVTLAHCF